MREGLRIVAFRVTNLAPVFHLGEGDAPPFVIPYLRPCALADALMSAENISVSEGKGIPMENNVSRRDFMKGAGAVLAGAAAMGLAGCASQEAGDNLAGTGEAATSDIAWDRETDVLVVGLGLAGCASAMSAADAGVQVLVVEKAPADFAGGASRVNGGFITVSEEFQDLEYCCRNVKGAFDREVMASHLDAVPMMEDWLEDEEVDGLEYAEFPGYVGYYNPKGLWDSYPSFVQHVTDRGVEIMYETPAVDLITNDAGEVIGAYAEQNGNRIAIKANKGVILCSGSYNASPELIERFAYPSVYIANLDSPYNTGDAIGMAERINAKIGGFIPDPLCWMGYVITAPSREAETGVQWNQPDDANGAYMMVNRFGERFHDETVSYGHARSIAPQMLWEEEINDYRNTPFWVVFNQDVLDNTRVGKYTAQEEFDPSWGTPVTMTWNGVFKNQPWSQDNAAEVERGWIVKGDTIEELAAAMTTTNGFGDTVNMDAAGLAASAAAFDAGIAAGADAFGRDVATMAPLGSGPYYACELSLGVIQSFGGPVVNADNQVLSNTGEPVGRLYAAGIVSFIFAKTSANPTALISGLQSGQAAAALESWSA